MREIAAQEQVIRALEDYILDENGLYGAGSISFEHQGNVAQAYPYIRATNDAFEKALLECARLCAEPVETLRFLEVGCGLGTKCGIARCHGLHATGIDIQSDYVELARKIFLECHFVEANAFDFEYSGFDLVYYHVPFFEDAMLFQLEQRILTQLKSGGVLFVTRLSQMLQDAVYVEGRVKALLRDGLSDPALDVGRIRVLQKLSEIRPDWIA